MLGSQYKRIVGGAEEAAVLASGVAAVVDEGAGNLNVGRHEQALARLKLGEDRADARPVAAVGGTSSRLETAGCRPVRT